MNLSPRMSTPGTIVALLSLLSLLLIPVGCTKKAEEGKKEAAKAEETAPKAAPADEKKAENPSEAAKKEETPVEETKVAETPPVEAKKEEGPDSMPGKPEGVPDAAGKDKALETDELTPPPELDQDRLKAVFIDMWCAERSGASPQELMAIYHKYDYPPLSNWYDIWNLALQDQVWARVAFEEAKSRCAHVLKKEGNALPGVAPGAPSKPAEPAGKQPEDGVAK